MVIYHFCPRTSEVNRVIQREREREGRREKERESVARHEVERVGAAWMD